MAVSEHLCFSSNGIAGSLFQSHRSNPNRSFLKLRVTPSSHPFYIIGCSIYIHIYVDRLFHERNHPNFWGTHPLMMLKFQVDVLEKGIMNLTDLLADLHHSHNAALETPGRRWWFRGFSKREIRKEKLGNQEYVVCWKLGYYMEVS